MTNTLLIAGTASHVGKSTVVAGLCRALSNQGVDVAPFKAQNMSNNARVALTQEGDWGEIGISQHVQARAARIPASTDLNPVLLKPRGDAESQLVIDGEAVGHVSAGDYYETHWDRALDAANHAYDRLAADHDVIIAEGAGSIAEVNLHDRDLANLETARFADASILILVDIERGGAFASLLGTVDLLPEDIRDRVVGAVITKFRGDESLLETGIDTIESRTGIPILGVIPYDDPGFPAEDSVSLPAVGEAGIIGADDGIPADQTVTIAVPRFPRLSNATDLEPLANTPGVRVRFVPLDAALDGADAVVLPGTKNTVDDLLDCRDAGFDAAITDFDGPIIGLCGGYQMLGERLTNAGIESTHDIDTVDGFGLLPVETRFSSDKHVERLTLEIDGVGPLAGAAGDISGYEIHMGDTHHLADLAQPLGPQSAATDRVLGTYLHGLFENETVRAAVIDTLYRNAERSAPSRRFRSDSPHEHAAELVVSSSDVLSTIAVQPDSMAD